jgi:hypothetical protein
VALEEADAVGIARGIARVEGIGRAVLRDVEWEVAGSRRGELQHLEETLGIDLPAHFRLFVPVGRGERREEGRADEVAA